MLLEIQRGDLVCAARGEVSVLAREFDRDDAGLRRRVDGELLKEGRDDALVHRFLRRIARQTEQDEHAFQRIETARLRIEFWIAFEMQVLDRAAGDIAGFDELDLARHRLGIELQGLLRLHVDAIGPREEGLLVLEEHLRLGRIARRHHRDEDRDEDECRERQRRDKATAAAQRQTEPTEIDLAESVRRPIHVIAAPRHPSSRCSPTMRERLLS